MDGKYPHLLPSANLEEPSALNEAVMLYLLFNEYQIYYEDIIASWR